MPQKDYYSILNISRVASEKEIKKAFRIQAKKFHPDSSSAPEGTVEIFQEINEAYDILSHPDKKKAYDTYLQEFESARSPESVRPPESSRSPESPRPQKSESRSSREGRGDYRSRESGVGKSRFGKRVWREENASFQSQNLYSSGNYKFSRNGVRSVVTGTFQKYRRWRKFRAYLAMILLLGFMIFLMRLMFPVPEHLERTVKGSLPGSADSIVVSPPRFLERPRATQKIRDELYQELIVFPAEEKRVSLSLSNLLKQYKKTLSVPKKNETLFSTDSEDDLSEEIWDDIQNQVSVP